MCNVLPLSFVLLKPKSLLFTPIRETPELYKDLFKHKKICLKKISKRKLNQSQEHEARINFGRILINKSNTDSVYENSIDNEQENKLLAKNKVKNLITYNLHYRKYNPRLLERILESNMMQNLKKTPLNKIVLNANNPESNLINKFKQNDFTKENKNSS